ncbi:MAG: RDD family protein, partial [Pseudomonadota bacterium]
MGEPDILMPPEGVPLHFPVAGFGVRVGAQITDVLITGLAAVAVLVLLVTTGAVQPWWIAGVGMALFFFIRIPYY